MEGNCCCCCTFVLFWFVGETFDEEDAETDETTGTDKDANADSGIRRARDEDANFGKLMVGEDTFSNNGEERSRE